jgi:hypothetical protein
LIFIPSNGRDRQIASPRNMIENDIGNHDVNNIVPLLYQWVSHVVCSGGLDTEIVTDIAPLYIP